ncbi:MAG: hypothetical protein JRG91_19760, partial [Deltaproteobacteria bacterium]|nr:hypothetical protein [Deltaproteobacteria bacterium]
MRTHILFVPLLLFLILALASCSKKGTSGDASGDDDTPDGADATDTVIPPDATDAAGDMPDGTDVSDAPGVCDGHEGTVFCDGTVAITCSADGEVVSEEECDDGMAGHCEDGVGCITPSYDREIDIAAMYSDDTLEDSVGVFLVDGTGDVDSEDFGTSKYRMRPVTLTLTWEFTEGSVSLDVSTTDLQLFRTDGTPIVTPATFTVADLPLDFLVHATTTTDGTINAQFTPPWSTLTPTDDVVRVRAVRSPGLAGRPLTGYPYFEFVDAFNDDEDVLTALDPNRFPDRESFGYDIHVVAHRTPAEWAADSSLTDVSGGTESSTPVAGSIADNLTDAWTTGLVAGDMLGTPYDVVFDFGRDGTLDPGDMIDGLYSSRAGLYVVKDLNLPGPYTTMSTSYTGGYWLTQKTYYPTGIGSMGRVPLVIISHGNGHLYTWYDYLGEHLASYGYVVMSHRNDT